MNSVVRVKVPQSHAAMITMLHLNLTGHRHFCDISRVNLVIYQTKLTKRVWRCRDQKPIIRHRFPKGANLYVHFQSGNSRTVGFKLAYSVLEESMLLQKGVADNMWNCSVPDFKDFKLHFPCDMYPQCVNKEDEHDCPYFSEECGMGFVTLGERCLFFEKHLPSGTWRDMRLVCDRRGGRLANFRRREDYDKIASYLNPLADVWAFYRILVGLHSASVSLPRMYQHELQHSDETVAFFRSSNKVSAINVVCGSFSLLANSRCFRFITLSYCSKTIHSPDVLCEIPRKSTIENSVKKIQLESLKSNANHSLHLKLLPCPLGHITRDFLACNYDSACWSQDAHTCLAPLTPLPPSFTCTNGFETVPYTFVCDFRLDCSDGSDEDFCKFPPCSIPEAFHCSDRQCVPWGNVCDGQKNCYNAVDEEMYSEDNRELVNRPPSPAIVHLGHQGRFTVHMMTKRQLADLRPAVCPVTHFLCPDNGYCMPVFLRCNGVHDCLGWQDEADCSAYTCPGFYRCRSSQVCLHPEQLCDGIFQCPQDDDELLCDFTCPAHCKCYGLALYCRRPFNVGNLSSIRYMDSRASGVAVSDLKTNVMLIYLNLAENSLKTFANLSFPNLRSLDLSDNQLTEIRLQDLSRLPQLESLSLSGNPILSLFRCVNGPEKANDTSLFTSSLKGIDKVPGDRLEGFDVTVHSSSSHNTDSPAVPKNVMFSSLFISKGNNIPSLRKLSLSRVRLKVLHLSFLSLLPNLHTVNMSGSGVDTLLGKGFQGLKQLHVLDLRGCPLTYFPRDLFLGLKRLEAVYADNYKLCCPATLPVGFFLQNCHAPSDEVSSCEALLRSNSYRVFLSVFAFLALLGNASSFIYRVVLQKRKQLLSFDIFVAHLCFADFFMGVYLSLIGVADHLYQGNYLWEDIAWKNSIACQMAGFVSLVSSEVSALVICLITIDCFLVIRFPFSTFHFGARSAQVTSLSAWSTGCLIAAVPLTPGAASWQFYGQTGICVPLPVSKASSAGYTYAFLVMIVANFIFFLVIAAGQVSIYWSVLTNSVSPSNATKKKTQDITIARRLITVAMSDFLCWFPISLTGILAATGTPIPGEVSVAMAVFVLPFNSALNPFLYTLNVALEKRRRADEDQLKDRLMAQFRVNRTDERMYCLKTPAKRVIRKPGKEII